MGNSQSTAERQKVAKPKTIGQARSFTKSTSPASQYEVSSPTSNVPYSNASESTSLVTLPLPTFEGLTEHEYRQHVRSQFLSPDGGASEKQSSQVDLLAATVARSLSKRGSTSAKTLSTKSSLAGLQNESQVSVTTYRTVDIDTAVTLLQELQKTASPDDLVALHQALIPSPSRDSLYQQSQEDQEEWGTSAAALIRRRSYAQPGIATRHEKPNTIPRKALPAPDAKPVWKREMMVASPLARLSSAVGLEPPAPKTENRAHTPSDLEYSTLGNLKHGSLLITNGRASPAPSMASPGRLGRRVSDEQDFFTASEQSSSPEITPPSSRHAITLNENNKGGLSDQSRQQSTEAFAYGSDPRKRDGSPLKQEILVESPEPRIGADAESIYSRHLRPIKSTSNLASRPESRFLYEDPPSDELVQPIILHTHHQGEPYSSVNLAKKYMAELPPSLFKESHDESFAQTRIDVDFEETHGSPIHETIIEKPFAVAPEVGQISPRKPLRSHPPVSDTGSSSRSSPPLAKSDSGYSSASVSVTSPLRANPLRENRPKSSTKAPLPIPTFEERFPPLPDTNPVNVFMMNRVGTDTAIVGSIEQNLTKEEKVKRSKSWRKSMRKSLPKLLSSDTATNFDSQLSLESTASKVDKQQPKKLQKRRPLSQPPIMMNDKHVLQKGPIPRVPSTVFSRYSGRLSMAPSMQFLERTYEDVVNERRDSASSRPATAAPIADNYFPDAQQGPPAPPTHRFGLGRRSLRRAKTQVEEDDDITGVTNFGTVSESLGSSPYDIAMTGPQRRYSGAPTLPHHLSTNAPRAGPREGWDAETASKIAQQRSRERAAQNQARGEQPLRRPPYGGSRPFSYHEGMHTQAYRQREQDADYRGSTYQNDMRNRAYPIPTARPLSMRNLESIYVPPERYYVQPQHQDSANLSPQAPPTRPKIDSSEYQRAPSPVKDLVSKFEQRSSTTTSMHTTIPHLPTLPQNHERTDWSVSQAAWRERRNLATTQTRTSASTIGDTTTTTTTTVTTLRPTIQARKSMPQMRGIQRVSPNVPSVPVFSEDGVFGRYGGGIVADGGVVGRRDGTPNTRAVKQLYGVDFGDVPYRVI